ncbi:MAG: peptidylprolyl isomerase [Holosporaceae bacterium]|jgi:peptidyl-prolyl cis-trans isomerase C|nr:peptidylprolyl isomerase [Holosporaceae bacterium]
MKAKVTCAMAALAFASSSLVHGGALKKNFNKDEQSKNIDIGEQSSSPAEEPKETPQPSEKQKDETSGNEKASAEATVPSSSESTEAADGASPTEEKKKIGGDPVVLRVNGKKEYRRSQILADMKLVPPQMVQGVAPDKLFVMLRDQKLNAYLMIEQAKKAGLDRTKEFIDRVEQLKEELLGRMFLMRELAPKAENESALKARYTKYLVEFKKGKEFQIFHIMVSTEDEAKGILAALERKEDFSKLAKEKSMAPSKDKGGEEGRIPVDMLPPQIKDKIILLKTGEHTKEYVKTDDGFHIFKVGEIGETSPQKYEEALPMLKQLIMHEEMTKMLDRLEKQVKVERFNEDGTPAAPRTKAPVPGSAPAQ